MRLGERPPAPPAPERGNAGPVRRERERLGRFERPSAKYLAVAALLLTEACTPFVRTVTAESGPVKGYSFDVELKPEVFEKQGSVSVTLRSEGEKTSARSHTGIGAPLRLSGTAIEGEEERPFIVEEPKLVRNEQRDQDAP